MARRKPSRRTRSATIPVRRMDLEFHEDVPRFYFDGNPFLTAMLSAMSVSFPAGERFFIHSVLHYLPSITNPALREAVQGFVGQEANHTKEHIAFNTFLDRAGFPASELEKITTARIDALTERLSPEQNLARTVAIEHFTTILSGAFLEHPEVFERTHPDAATLWAWHAIEEIEHRSVAYDVYQEVCGDEALLRRAMVAITVIFVVANGVRMGQLLASTGDLANVRAARQAAKVLFGERGVFRGLGKRYLSFYRKGFHPSQHAFELEVARAKARYLGARA